MVRPTATACGRERTRHYRGNPAFRTARMRRHSRRKHR
jgi:hypothetical protein